MSVILPEMGGAPSSVVFLSPASISNGVSYELKKGEESIQTGDYWLSSMEFNLSKGSYVLVLTVFGTSLEYNFDMPSAVSTIDLSSSFCAVNVSGLVGSTTIACNGTTIDTTSDSSFTFYAIRGNDSLSLTASSNETYSGVTSGSVFAYNSTSVTPSSETVSVSMVKVGTIITIATAGKLNIPISGKFEILAIGGGSGGLTCSSSDSNGGGGGAGGRITSGTYSVPKGEYSITIGAGGNANSSGGATSFGTILSASGGDGLTNSNGAGCHGGSGGGGGGNEDGTTSYGGKGGNGEYGGGGGGSGALNVRAGGSGGTYGGNGGDGGKNQSTNGTAGSTGTSPPLNSIYYDSSRAGGQRGVGLSGNNYGGGGGGGGRGASGGNGGSISTSVERGYAGGGGGGGVAGGTGGAGGSVTTNSASGGSRGLGYGAGGGGGGTYYQHVVFNYTGPLYLSGGGGGGGGLSSTAIASSGGTGSSTSNHGVGGSGAKGAVRLQFLE